MLATLRDLERDSQSPINVDGSVNLRVSDFLPWQGALQGSVQEFNLRLLGDLALGLVRPHVDRGRRPFGRLDFEGAPGGAVSEGGLGAGVFGSSGNEVACEAESGSVVAVSAAVEPPVFAREFGSQHPWLDGGGDSSFREAHIAVEHKNGSVGVAVPLWAMQGRRQRRDVAVVIGCGW